MTSFMWCSLVCQIEHLINSNSMMNFTDKNSKLFGCITNIQQSRQPENLVFLHLVFLLAHQPVQKSTVEYEEIGDDVKILNNII